jgi:hypothetical protein
MAKQLNMQFSGRIGPLIGVLRYGKYHYRIRSGKIQQTEATKASSSIFALASKAGKIMRLYLGHSIPNPKDINMQRQLVGRISNWLRLSGKLPPHSSTDIPFVNHFNFNLAKPLEEALRIPLVFKPTGPGQTELQLPAFIPVEVIKAPAHTTQIEFCISAVSLRLNNDNSFGYQSITITIPYNNTAQPARQVVLPLQTEEGNILIAAIQLRFMMETKSKLTMVKAYKLPAAIVGAVYL